ncbi:MAG: gamma-glutamylcyclotransferase family protein [Bacillota bacterium]
MKVFAYGSNLSRERLLKRVPSAKFLGCARLNGYLFRFHKRSIDGSGKANAFYTGRDSDYVWGAVFECSSEDIQALDRAEGLGSGYNEENATVAFEDGVAAHEFWRSNSHRQRRCRLTVNLSHG